MTLFFLIAITLVLTITIARRDRKYLKRELKETVSEDTKRFLNIPVEKDTPFQNNLEEAPKQKKLSRQILEDLNQTPPREP